MVGPTGLNVRLLSQVGIQSEPLQEVKALSPDAQGQRLLVGRDEMLQLVSRRLHKDGKITCLDGQVGIGKTSVANVAAKNCFDAYLNRQTTQLLIPCDQLIDLKRDQDVDEYCKRVFIAVAQTLLGRRGTIKSISFDMERADQLNAWLNEPIATH
ncbi:MAG: hypothetical protein ACKO15_02520, partial [Burkholderiales bacterium]